MENNLSIDWNTQAFDPNQYLSANNLIETPTTNWKGIGQLGGALIGSAAGIYGAIQQQKDSKKTIDQLMYELRRKKAQAIYEWEKEDAQNQLSFWGSGQRITGSAMGTLISNKNIVDSNIRDMERAYNAQIENLRSQARNNLIGSIVKGVGSVAMMALAL